MKQPRIAVVACKWYPLIGLEDASKDGFCFPSNTTLIPAKCTGVVKASFLLELFVKGFDGVLVLGCAEDDCRYLSGSKMCKQVAQETKRILAISGIDEARLCFESMSEGSGKELRKHFESFSRRISLRG